MPLQITFAANEINDYLRVDTGQDATIITTIKKAALREAEEFLNTDFSTTVTNEDGTTTNTPVEAPDDVKEWVLNRIVEKYENRGKPVKPDYSTLKAHRVLPFKAAENLNIINGETPETDAVNGVS